jgi:hypothetical protein
VLLSQLYRVFLGICSNLKNFLIFGDKSQRNVIVFTGKESMFIEQAGDAEQAELFAMGLIKEPKDYGTLTLVPCKHRVFCRTHGTFWIRKKFWFSGINRKHRRLYLLKGNTND